jgi:hypothetical protein
LTSPRRENTFDVVRTANLVIPALFTVLTAAACMPTPVAYKTTVASMISCPEDKTDVSKPDMSDDSYVHASGCGKTMDAVCDLTDQSHGGRCISVPAKLDDMLRWTLDGANCTSATFTVAAAFKDKDDYREYDVRGCGSTDQSTWRCGAQLDGSKRTKCLQKLGD